MYGSFQIIFENEFDIHTKNYKGVLIYKTRILQEKVITFSLYIFVKLL